MSELIRVRKKSQITLPPSVKKSLGIEEGDYLDIQIRKGEIVLKAKKLIDKNQSWFWTNRWQQGEKEAEEDIQAGRVQSFAGAEEAISFLKKQVGKKTSKTMQGPP